MIKVKKILALDRTGSYTLYMSVPELSFEDEQRFWISVRPNIQTGCWEWQKSTDYNGYGYFSFGRKTYKAHRVSWRVCRQEDPGDFWLCHTCDNPCCVNPDHLFLGTAQDNADDRTTKGRSKGCLGPAYLSPSDIQEVRRLRSKHTVKELAEMFNVSSTSISRYCKGTDGPRKTRKFSSDTLEVIRLLHSFGYSTRQIADEVGESYNTIYKTQKTLGLTPHKGKHAQQKLTDEQVAEMRDRYASPGVTMKQVAKEYGVNPATARAILAGKHR